MPNKLMLFCISVPLLFFACSDNTDFQNIDVLPVSMIEYTEIEDGISTTETFIEGDQFRFEDSREIPVEDCDLFRTRIRMTQERGNFSRVIGMIFQSKVDSALLQDNYFLFENADNFEIHISQQPFELIDISDVCNLDESETGIQFVSTETQLPILNTTSIVSGEILKFDTNTILFNDLGYLIVDTELNYSALRISNITGVLESSDIQVQVKLQHALRFPEIDN